MLFADAPLPDGHDLWQFACLPFLMTSPAVYQEGTYCI